MPYLGKEPARVPVTAADIPDNSITAAKIIDGAITIADIANDAVTEDKLANSINTAIAANTAKTGITSGQASAITANTAKTGITSTQADAIVANTAKTGITSTQADAIVANTAKTGITSGQASAITANTAKTGITSSQASAITANTAKTGITSSQASAITANTAKTGITSGQASAITANTAKVTNSTSASDLASGTLPSARLPAGSVLQVVSVTSDDQTSSTSSTLTSVLNLSITPSSTTSKILLMVDGQFSCSTDTYGSAHLYRGSTSIGESTEAGVGTSDTTCWQPINHRDSEAQWENEIVSGTYLDSPNTTSATTYYLKYKKDYGGTIWFNRAMNGSNAAYHWNSVSTMTLMEIGA